MKAKDLAEKLLEYQDFDVQFNFTDGFSKFPNVRHFKVTGISDIGHSDKVLILDGVED
ncbi:hypothetical protein [Cellulosilyticum lentocellum]|uniref:Uncharacterized protein n=1 Tax=Cellulosilyticum lentocellum (strain ATCC 49066 / DSM 5427 / NCIMB 11756 / RHM5) TaxID=642492 RepID=F2JQU6_CELLD|nr:hypothetical protein [Cellulosilyticum lentocellum]ADZ82691.1 hypothetical protein Clole_0959 [Cellulosilyticum lentocellum DSM 5427]